MKLIAHRGASLLCRENTLESLLTATSYGAYAVECDLSFRTADGKYIVFHDPDLIRIANDPAVISETAYEQISDILWDKAGYRPIVLEDLIANYHAETPVLLDIGLPAEQGLIDMIKTVPFPFILGISRPQDVRIWREAFPDKPMLGFVPSPDHIEAFVRDGVNFIRLWEQWLCDITPSDVKAAAPDIEVWIMSNRNGCMDGSAESLDYFEKLGADGALLNDITLENRR